jgi:(p)ppGpp synthase/HD superfamily hydrolase
MKDQVQLAREIATKAHDGQFRWDGETPYISHPAAIARVVATNYNSVNFPHFVIEATATAWLHDVVEDTPLTIVDLRAAGISESILTAVDLLTKREGQSYLDYLLQLKNNEIARVVKIEDIRNNMSDLDRKKKKSMYEKYQLALYILGG